MSEAAHLATLPAAPTRRVALAGGRLHGKGRRPHCCGRATPGLDVLPLSERGGGLTEGRRIGLRSGAVLRVSCGPEWRTPLRRVRLVHHQHGPFIPASAGCGPAGPRWISSTTWATVTTRGGGTPLTDGKTLAPSPQVRARPLGAPGTSCPLPPTPTAPQVTPLTG